MKVTIRSATLADVGAIAAILREEIDPQTACQILVDAANSAGGYDNITVVIINWGGPDIDIGDRG